MQVGYIRLASFTSRAQSDVASAIRGLSQEGAEAFVLDLRDNRGGLIQEGIEVAKLFLDGMPREPLKPFYSKKASRWPCCFLTVMPRQP